MSEGGSVDLSQPVAPEGSFSSGPTTTERSAPTGTENGTRPKRQRPGPQVQGVLAAKAQKAKNGASQEVLTEVSQGVLEKTLNGQASTNENGQETSAAQPEPGQIPENPANTDPFVEAARKVIDDSERQAAREQGIDTNSPAGVDQYADARLEARKQVSEAVWNQYVKDHPQDAERFASTNTEIFEALNRVQASQAREAQAAAPAPAEEIQHIAPEPTTQPEAIQEPAAEVQLGAKYVGPKVEIGAPFVPQGRTEVPAATVVPTPLETPAAAPTEAPANPTEVAYQPPPPPSELTVDIPPEVVQVKVPRPKRVRNPQTTVEGLANALGQRESTEQAVGSAAAPTEAVPTPPGPAIPTEAQPTGQPIPEPEPTPTEADLNSTLATGGAGNGGETPPPTDTGQTPPEEPASGEPQSGATAEPATATEKPAESQDHSIRELYQGATVQELEDDLEDARDRLTTLRRRAANAATPQQRDDLYRQMGEKRLEIRTIERELEQKKKEQPQVETPATQAERRTTVNAYQREIEETQKQKEEFQDMPFEDLKRVLKRRETTVADLKKEQKALGIPPDNAERAEALTLQIQKAQAELNAAKSIHDSRMTEETKKEAEETQKKFEAELKQLEAERLKSLGEKTSIVELQTEVAKWGKDTDTLNAEVIAARAAYESALPDKKEELGKAYAEKLKLLNEAARNLAGAKQALENHPDAVAGKDRMYKFNADEFDNANSVRKGEILTAYGEKLVPEPGEFDIIAGKLSRNENVSARELAIYSKEMGDILGKKKEGKVDMKEFKRLTTMHKGLQESVFAQVAEAEATLKAFQERYPSNWRKILNFAKGHPGWMWLIMVLLGAGVVGTTTAFGAMKENIK